MKVVQIVKSRRYIKYKIYKIICRICFKNIYIFFSEYIDYIKKNKVALMDIKPLFACFNKLRICHFYTIIYIYIYIYIYILKHTQVHVIACVCKLKYLRFFHEKENNLFIWSTSN